MAYIIDARLEQGVPLLTLIDPVTGKERLHWRGGCSNSEHNWQSLFKQLFLLSCADRLSLIERTRSPRFSNPSPARTRPSGWPIT